MPLCPTAAWSRRSPLGPVGPAASRTTAPAPRRTHPASVPLDLAVAPLVARLPHLPVRPSRRQLRVRGQPLVDDRLCTGPASTALGGAARSGRTWRRARGPAGRSRSSGRARSAQFSTAKQHALTVVTSSKGFEEWGAHPGRRCDGGGTAPAAAPVPHRQHLRRQLAHAAPRRRAGQDTGAPSRAKPSRSASGFSPGPASPPAATAWGCDAKPRPSANGVMPRPLVANRNAGSSRRGDSGVASEP